MLKFHYFYAVNLCQTASSHRMCLCQGIGIEESMKSTFIDKGSTFHCFYAVNLCQTASIIEVFWIALYAGTPHILRLPTTVITCVSGRYFGLHFTQVPHTYCVSQPLSSHVSLSWNRHRRIAEIDVYRQGFDISLLLYCQLVPNCSNDWHVRQNFKSLLVFLVVRSSQFTQNFNCNVLYIYPKLEL